MKNTGLLKYMRLRHASFWKQTYNNYNNNYSDNDDNRDNGDNKPALVTNSGVTWPCARAVPQ